MKLSHFIAGVLCFLIILISKSLLIGQCLSVEDDTVRGFLFSDFDRDGSLNGIDTVLPGVKVYLYLDKNNDGIIDLTDIKIDSAVTLVDGSYEFNIAPSSKVSTFNSQISSSANDAEQNGSTMDLTGVDLDGGSEIIGLRFTNISVPVGTQISDARLTFTAESTDGGSATFNIYCHDTDNSGVFTTASNNISSRPKTTSFLNWSPPNWNTGSSYSTPNLIAPVQEVMDRVDWNYNNSLSFIINSSGNDRDAWAYDGNTSLATQLSIQYTEFDTSDNYIVVINETDINQLSGYSIDSLQTAFFDCGGQSEVNRNFGIVHNFPPTAGNDYDTALANTLLIIDVLENDSDPEANLDPGSVDTAGLLQPLNGSITAIDTVTGEITYWPGTNFIGYDTFQYVVCDSLNECDTATVFIYVGYHLTEVDCGNGFDDDGDGLTDCSDPDCTPASICACTVLDDTIRGSVFNDINGNGNFEVSDTGFDGITVRLYRDVNKNGIIDGPDVAIDSVITTAPDGDYMFTVTAPTPTIFSRKVNYGEDDAYEKLSDGSVSINDKLKLGDHSGDYSVATRFRNIGIPKTSIIQTAYIEFYAHDGEAGNTDMTIFGEASDNPSAYTNLDFDISARVKTSDSVSWIETNPWIQDQKYQSADISSLVSEIIDRPGWSTGGNMAFMIEGNSPTNKRNATDWNKIPEEAPKLVVSYIDSSSIDYYLIDVNENTLPAGFTFTTPTYQSVVFSCGGQAEIGQDLGGTIKEICNNLIDDDNDGLIDCMDTIDCRPDRPAAITPSNNSICINTNGETYSITPVPGATSYTWTVPPGATITSGQGTSSITVDWTTTAGDVCVVSNNAFCSSLTRCEYITIIFAPLTPSSINH